MEVIALRGIPGAGKDHYVAANRGDGDAVVSADDWFLTPEGYAFDPARLPVAHLNCFEDYLERLDDGKYATVYVNNTNLHAWEIAPYERHAVLHRAPFLVVTLWCPFEVALRRQTHKVPPDKLFQMYQTLTSERLPAHWKHEVLLTH